MTKIDEVARAILKARFYDCEPEMYGNDLDAFFREIYADHIIDAHDEARAAIEAMREPTKQMLSGVRPQEYTIEHYHGSGHHRSFPTLGSGPVQVWQDMIDAALREDGR